MCQNLYPTSNELVGLSAMLSGLGRAERGGVHSLSTDCGLDLDGPITVSPYDPPPALLSGSRRLARLAGPTPARAWPTYLPLPESTNETSSPSRGQPPVRADSSRPPPPPSRFNQVQDSRVAGAVAVKTLVTPTRRHPSRGREGAPRGESGGRGGGTRTLAPWAHIVRVVPMPASQLVLYPATYLFSSNSAPWAPTGMAGISSTRGCCGCHPDQGAVTLAKGAVTLTRGLLP